MVKKISIIGAGRVGESAAQMIAINKLARKIILVDLDDAYAKGVALDIQETSSVYKFDSKIIGDNKISIISGSDIIIICAGVARKPGMHRDDVLDTNIRVIDNIMDGIIEYASDAFVIMVTNPVDILTYYALKKSKWDKNRIIGQAGILDSMRLASFIAMETEYSIDDIQAMVMGGHGDTMVPLTRYTTISGISIDSLIDGEAIRRIMQRTRDGGAEILGLKRNSSAYNSPGAAITTMVEAIVYDKKRLLPCITLLEGEYGFDDIAIGVPIILGADGVIEIVQIDLNGAEKELFNNSAQTIKLNINGISNYIDEIK